MLSSLAAGNGRDDRDDDEPKPARAPKPKQARGARASRRKPSKPLLPIGNILRGAVYWTTILGLWLAIAIGGSLWVIIGSIVVEPPAALIEAINRSNARLLRLVGRPVTP